MSTFKLRWYCGVHNQSARTRELEVISFSCWARSQNGAGVLPDWLRRQVFSVADQQYTAQKFNAVMSR